MDQQLTPAQKANAFIENAFSIGEKMKLEPHQLHACAVSLLVAAESASGKYAPIADVRSASDDTIKLLRARADKQSGGN
jgi:hypothetical protein